MRARRVAHATVWAVIASLIELLLSQPFHASERYAARGGAPALVAAGPVSALATAHDADLCSMCRATLPSGLMMTVDRMTPMMALPYIIFSPQAP